MSSPGTRSIGWLRRARLYLTGAPAWVVLTVIAMLMGISVWRLVFPSAVGKSELIILTGRDESNSHVRQQLIAKWNNMHPDHPARLEELSSTADKQHSEMVAEAQKGDSDVALYNLDITWIAEFAAAGYIRPLSESTDVTGFLQPPLDTCFFDEKLYALPFNTDAALLYYRTDVVSDPTKLPSLLPPTQADMQVLARARHGITAGYAGQLAKYEGLTVNALEAIWAAGGDVVHDGHVVLDTKQAHDGLQNLADGLKDGGGGLPNQILPASKDFKEGDSTQAFRNGQVALMRNWPVAYDLLKTKPEQGGAQQFNISENFDVAPLPGHSVLGGQNLAIASTTKHVQLAQELAEFLTSDESEKTLFKDGGFAATREAAYLDASVLEKRPYAEDLLTAVRGARLRPVTPHYWLFSSVFQGIVVFAMANGGDLPDGAVARLTDAFYGRVR